jgi:Zn-finger nucleic acid-binding protein
VLCPKCRARLERHELKPELVINACPKCRGAWFDPWNLAAEPDVPEWRDTQWPCPRCSSPLVSGARGATVERCRRCRGLWLDTAGVGLRQVLAREDALTAGLPPEDRAPKPTAPPPPRPPEKPALDPARRRIRKNSLLIGGVVGFIPALLTGYVALFGMSDSRPDWAFIAFAFAGGMLIYGGPIALVAYVVQRLIHRRKK